MIPFNYELWRSSGGYKFTNSKEMMNQLMNMNDIKAFSKNEKEQEILMQTITICCQKKRMKFSIEKMCHANCYDRLLRVNNQITQHGDMSATQMYPKVSEECFLGSTYTKIGKVFTTAAAALCSTSLVLG